MSKILKALLAARNYSQKHSRAFGILGFCGFIGFVIYSAATFPTDDVESFNFWLLLPCYIVVAPLMQLANALEFRAQGRMLDEDISLRECHDVTLNASMANMLPIPGSVLIRTIRLSRNNDKKQAALTSVIVGLCWLGVSLLIGGVSLSFYSRYLLAGGLVLAGVLLTGGSFHLYSKLTSSLPEFSKLIVVQIYLTAVSTLNMYLAFRTIGFPISTLQTTVVIVSGPVASSVGVFPSGIGLAESIVSFLSTLIGISAKVGFLAAALARLNIIIGILLGKLATLASSRMTATATTPAEG